MSVFKLLSEVASFFKIRDPIENPVIDNLVFRAHYRLTSGLFFVACLIVSANSLVGQAIECIYDDKSLKNVINTYCWIQRTFTLPYEMDRKVGMEVAHHGLGNDNQEKTYHSYYQWVPFFLFFQGILFLIPHLIWKHVENGKIKCLSQGMRGNILGVDKERKKRQSLLVKYLIDSRHHHGFYAFCFFFCEILNFFNVILNMYMMNKFLGGTFLNFGFDVINFHFDESVNRTDPMVKIFPRVTKCTFYNYGQSGTIQKHDAMCILALNVVNEKIYIFLWFWFNILFVLSGLAVLYRSIQFTSVTVRATILKRRIRHVSDIVQNIVKKSSIGEFMVFNLLAKNINTLIFGRILEEYDFLTSIKTFDNLKGILGEFQDTSVYPEMIELLERHFGLPREK